ncbi:MAG: amino acid adenylation domain-containing protein [Clostridiales bacterium]|nr:amino acid adenylation domain-containing protein [Clostridiales bacterium]
MEKAEGDFPGRVAYQDGNGGVTFSQVADEARRIGSLLCRYAQRGQPVIVIAHKHIFVPSLYMGVAYAGCFYIPLAADLPSHRLKTIMSIVNAGVILTDGQCDELIASLEFEGQVVSSADAKAYPIDKDELGLRANQRLDTDPLYVLFTSGSSGLPKGVITPHRAVIDYINVFAQTFGITEKDVLGNQAPLDYVAAIRDIFLPMNTGAKTVLIPKTLFSMPHKLFEYVNENKITTLCWVASALALCSELNVFDETRLDTVRKVIFTGSVLPNKHLRVWQKNMPGVMFANHYGPTEITASCTYYIVDREFSDSEAIPIGVPFKNTDVLLLDEDGVQVGAGGRGEICVRGSSLALGYYRNPEKTKEAFVKNPSQKNYDEVIYKTGDIGSWSDDGNLMFHGRMDFQIKHMGHRVELGEIEAAADSMEQITSSCCLYHQEKEQIWLFYAGETGDRELAIYLRERLPSYMVPRKFAKLDAMPKSFNGKIDMAALREMMEAQ